MSFLRRYTAATEPSGLAVRAAGLIGAAMLASAAITQLIMFEDFPAVLAVYPLPGGYGSALLFASVLVTAEVLAVPYLVMMRLSPLMKGVSLMCGWLSSVVWLALGAIRIVQGGDLNSGLLGATVAVPTGWPALIFVTVVSMGLLITGWPSKRSLTAGR